MIQSRNILSIIIWTNMDKRAAPDSGIKTLLSERNVKIETTGVFLDENEAAFFAWRLFPLNMRLTGVCECYIVDG